ncbi:plasmid mobilization protein [Gardnerella piotii]|uniref:plasmid mobilization protein n=1 Tax=Gardnerella piotii TaxID=2792977 RepID=UPI0012BD8272
MEDGNKKEKRMSVSISLTDRERDELRGCAERYGLSLSAFLRLAATEYVDNHNSIQERE